MNCNIMEEKQQKEKHKKIFLYKFLLESISNLEWKILFLIITIVSLMITYINYHRQPNLPFFPLFWALFFCIFVLSFNSLKMNAKNNTNLNETMIMDIVLIGKRMKYEKGCCSNINLIFHLLSCYVFILPLCYNKPIDSLVLWTCFATLFFIVNMSIMGYTQYIYFIKLIHSIKTEQDAIKTVNEDIPNDTKWLVFIAQNVQKYNNMFFIVGMFYIILFYIFSFSGMCIEVNNISQFLIIQIAWGILVVGIVIVYPLSSVLVIKDIKCISQKLKSQQISKLKTKRSYVEDENIKNTYTSIILLIKQMPDYPIKMSTSSIFASCVELINILAAFISLEPIYQWVMKLI